MAYNRNKQKMSSSNFYNNIKDKRILITGNTGFVGSYLSLTLSLMGAKILGYSLKMNNKNFLSNKNEFKKKIKTINSDIIEIQKYYKKINLFKPEIIIHLASQSLVKESYLHTSETYKTNIFGTIELMELARKLKNLKHILIFTSDKVYENLDGSILNENSKLGGVDPYSSSKSSQDIISNSYKQSFFKKKLNVSIIRAGNIIGGGDWNLSRLVPDIYSSIYTKKKLKIRNPNAIRPWQHVLDVINAIIFVLLKNKQSININTNIFNIGPNLSSNLTVKELVKKIKKKSNFNFLIKKIKFKESKILRLSNHFAKKKIGWRPKLNINQTINLTNIWYDQFFIDKKSIYKFTEKQIISFFNLK